jgi:ATP/ADP translocase
MWYFLFFILLPEIETKKIWLYLILYFTGVFALIGVVIFGVNELYKDNLHFSFAACVIGGIAGIIAGAVPVVAKYIS